MFVDGCGYQIVHPFLGHMFGKGYASFQAQRSLFIVIKSERHSCVNHPGNVPIACLSGGVRVGNFPQAHKIVRHCLGGFYVI